MQKYTQVRVDPQSVIIEGLRQLDESRIIRSRLPDTRIWVVRQVDEIPPEAQVDDVERAIWEKCGTERSVEEIQSVSPATRFRTLKVLYRFVEEGWLRALSFGEMLEIARQLRKRNEAERAAEHYRFLRDWGVPESSGAAFLTELGRFLVELGRKKEASATLGAALEALRREGQTKEAWEIGRVLRSISPSDLQVLQQLWTLRAAASPRALEELRKELLGALRRHGEYHEAEALLGELEAAEGKKIEYWVIRAELARKIGQRDLAVDYLEHAGRIAEETGDRPEAIRVIRLLHELDPELPGLRTRLENLLRREEGAQRLRKIRRIGLAAGVVAVLALVIPAVRYEVQARTLFRQSAQLRTASAETAKLERARTVLREIVDEYGMSTVAGRSRAALAELDTRIAEAERLDRERAEELELVDRSSRDKIRKEAEALIIAARIAEEAGRFEEARAALDKLLDGPSLSLPLDAQARIKLPLSIETEPVGATVRIGGVEVGKTPYVHRFAPESAAFKIVLSRPGCEDQEITHTDDGKARIHVRMGRAPLAVGALLGGLDRAATSIPGYFLVPCRDGRIYALPDTSEVTQRARRVLAGGRVGHPSALLVAGANSLVIASYDGVISCLDTKVWETLWSVRLDSPVLAAVGVPGGAVAIGDEQGCVHLLDGAAGRTVGRSDPSFPVRGLAVRGDVLIVTDCAHRVRTFELPGLELIEERSLPAAVSAVLADGSLLLADGTRHAPEGVDRWPPPATDVAERDGRLIYGSADGRWVEFDGAAVGIHSSPTPLACPPLLIGKRVFLGGRDGRIHCTTSAGESLWAVDVSSPPVELLPTSTGHVLALLRNGQLLLMDGRSE
jgi:outer membrane protein assembly factor BamB/tetratricopeptide (TPR) repeat protein